MNTLNLAHLIQQVILAQPDRDMQYKTIMLVLDVDRHTAKKLIFQWIYRAEHSTLRKTVMDYIKPGN